MQVALTFEESKQRTLVPKQVVGLAAALLAGAAITPMNMHAVQGLNSLSTSSAIPSTSAASHLDINVAEIGPNPTDNLRIMEEKAGAQTFSCLTVSNIQLIEAKKEILQLQEKIVAVALSWEGIQYRWGGRTKAGVDCSGLVQRVYREHGITLPRTSYEQFRAGVGIAKANLQEGDLVFFNTNGAGASHVGIYLGNGQFISATKSCVEIESLDHAYWASTYQGSRRVLALQS